MGGAGETSEETSGQICERASAFLRSHVLCAKCVMASARGHKVGAFFPWFRIRAWISCKASDEVDELVDLGVCRWRWVQRWGEEGGVIGGCLPAALQL